MLISESADKANNKLSADDKIKRKLTSLARDPAIKVGDTGKAAARRAADHIDDILAPAGKRSAADTGAAAAQSTLKQGYRDARFLAEAKRTRDIKKSDKTLKPLDDAMSAPEGGPEVSAEAALNPLSRRARIKAIKVTDEEGDTVAELRMSDRKVRKAAHTRLRANGKALRDNKLGGKEKEPRSRLSAAAGETGDLLSPAANNAADNGAQTAKQLVKAAAKGSGKAISKTKVAHRAKQAVKRRAAQAAARAKQAASATGKAAASAAKAAATRAASLAAALAPSAAPVAIVLGLIVGTTIVVGVLGGSDPDQGSSGGKTIIIPEPYGTLFTVTCYDEFDGRWDSGTKQAEVCQRWHDAGAVYTDGIATIDGRMLIACTSKYGNVGDSIDFYLDDGTKLECIMADEKSQSDAGCNEWGHDNGLCVLEFEVLGEYYYKYGNPGMSTSWKGEWLGKRVCKAVNLSSGGSSTVTSAQRQAAINAAKGLLGEGYTHNNSPGEGFDCNGLCWYAWQQAGVDIPLPSGHYTDSGQFQFIRDSGRWVTSESDLKPGDLVFFSYDGGSSIFHVAMYIGDGQVIQSSEGTGVSIEDLHWCSGFCGGGSVADGLDDTGSAT